MGAGIAVRFKKLFNGMEDLKAQSEWASAMLLSRRGGDATVITVLKDLHRKRTFEIKSVLGLLFLSQT